MLALFCVCVMTMLTTPKFIAKTTIIETGRAGGELITFKETSRFPVFDFVCNLCIYSHCITFSNSINRLI